MMLNQRGTLLWIFVILFVFSMYSIGFAQSGQKSDSELSESRYIILIQEIRQLDTKMAERMGEQNTKMAEKLGELETKMRDHVDKKISEVNTDLKDLQDDVAFMKGMFTTIRGITTTFGGPLLVGILIGIIINYIQNRKNKTKVNTENKMREDSEVVYPKEIDPKNVLSQDNINESVTI